MSNIFINIGSGLGEGIDLFYKEVEDAADWQIHCFEPLLYNQLVYNMRVYPNVMCVEAAMSDKDGEGSIYFSRPNGVGSTMLFDKLTGDIDYDNGILVTSIDFVRWFKNNIRKEDFVIVAINIEGSEYLLLPRLPEIISQINGLHLKLHQNKFHKDKRLGLHNIQKQFEKEIQGCSSYVICDLTDRPFNFRYLLRISNYDS